jgi:hypothetical protein
MTYTRWGISPPTAENLSAQISHSQPGNQQVKALRPSRSRSGDKSQGELASGDFLRAKPTRQFIVKVIVDL